MIRYLSARGAEVIEISEATISHILNYRQTRSTMKEAGGQLFARFSFGVVHIERATGPSLLDRRTRYSFAPSNWNAARVIRAMHKRGLHYVGDWHTHPEPVPTPSADDRDAIRAAYDESVHHLSGFLMVIAGTEPPPKALFVAIADAEGLHRLSPVPSPVPFPSTESEAVHGRHTA